ncbi:MAG: thermonuclease family protein [Actinomycetia bacterium]|nr:thermonuclease family protein [Actinomycetes bacterium]
MRRAMLVVICLTLALSACAAPEPGRARTGGKAAPSERATHKDPPDSDHQGGSSGGGAGTVGVRRLAKGLVSAGWQVSRIVDGDTVDVTKRRRTLTLRLIGIDTPETVHPTEPIECYGPEATKFATWRLLGEPVALEFDRSQGRLDYYDRTLAYIWITDGKPQQFNRDAVRRGYALEYTYDAPYLWQREFLRAQDAAVDQSLGVWRCPHPGS